jgi:hypothetical protein
VFSRNTFYIDSMRSGFLSVVLHPPICGIDRSIKLLVCVLSFFFLAFTNTVFHCSIICIPLSYSSVIDRGVCYSVLLKVDYLLLVSCMIMVFLALYVLCAELIRYIFYCWLCFLSECHTLQKKTIFCSVMYFLFLRTIFLLLHFSIVRFCFIRYNTFGL